MAANLRCGIPCRASKRSDAPLDDSELGGKHQCGLVEAARYARKDAMLVTAAAQNMDSRARNDLVLLARGFSRLDMRARQDVALIGLKVLKLDARARERAYVKAGRINRMATKLKEMAGSELKTAASEHWSDGALEADIRMADLRARRRAMEDTYAAFQAMKSIHDATVEVLLMKEKIRRELDSTGVSDAMRAVTYPAATVLDRIEEFEKAYSSMATLFAEVDALENSDPDELEYILATLLDMDEVDGGSGASLVTESAKSPDSATRRALADALANAPSLWALGNAGISALQRLANDENHEVASAASRALQELENQWKQLDANMLFDATPTEDPDKD